MQKHSTFFQWVFFLVRLSVCALVVLTAIGASRQSAHAAGTISGRVYQDFNANGIYDTTATLNNSGSGTIAVAVDRGVQSVTVRAYDSSGTLQGSATTGSNGLYSLSAGSTGPYRIEFDSTTFPSGYVAAPAGTGNGTTVQFVSDGNTSNVNLGLERPGEYCQNNPTLVTPCYYFGASNGTSGDNGSFRDEGTLKTFPYAAGTYYADTVVANMQNTLNTNWDQPTASNLTTFGTIGATWGIAYRRSTERLYVAAFYKRHSGFGPGADGVINNSDDPGAVYVINPNSGAVTATYTVPNATTNPHNTSDYNTDNNNSGWDGVGKASLGGIALNDDESVLYVMNLQNRTLYALNAGTGAVLNSTGAYGTGVVPTNQNTLATNACTVGTNAVNIRPFAVNYYNDYNASTNDLYVGITCTGQSNASTSNMFAYVYSVNPSTLAFSSTPVFSMALNYARRCVNDSTQTTAICQSTYPAAWNPWTTTITRYVPSGVGNNASYPQPWLTDIAFDNGNLILGLRDRAGDQFGLYTTETPSTGNSFTARGIGGGDTLRACGSPATGWTLESNGRCNSIGNAPQNTSQGPGNGEYYYEENYARWHDEVSTNGLMQIPGYPDVVTNVYDPIRSTDSIDSAPYSGGTRWLSNAGAGANNSSAGSTSKGYRLYQSAFGGGTTPTTAKFFGKANGLGDLIALCSSAPIQIGNRVWSDSNKDGIQDANEAGIANVLVQLTDSSGNVLATALTDSSGNYFFSNDPRGYPSGGNNAPNATSGGGVSGGFSQDNQGGSASTASSKFGILGLVAGGTYFVRIDRSQTALNALTNLSPANVGSNAFINSKGTATTLNSVNYSRASVTLGSAGNNDHRYDFGFYSTPTAIDLGEVQAKANDDGSVLVKWETLDESNLLGFNVLRSAKKNGAVTQLNAELVAARSVGQLAGNRYTFRDSNVQGGKRYFYRIELVRPNGTSETSAAVVVRTKVTSSACSGKPNVPTLAGPEDGKKVKKGKVTFTWNPVECAVSYKWQLRGDASDGESIASKKDLTTTQTSIKKLQPGRTYYWRVQACNAAGKCSASEWSSIVVKQPKEKQKQKTKSTTE